MTRLLNLSHLTRWTLAALAVATTAAIAPVAQAEQPAASQGAVNELLAPQVDMKQVSYLIGRDIAENLIQGFASEGSEMGLDFEALKKGLLQGLDNQPSDISQQDAEAVMQAFQQKMMLEQIQTMQKQQAEMADMAEANALTAQAFLAQNLQKEGVQSTESGLQYRVITQGEGEKVASPNDVVTVHYTGTLPDGTVFDSSRERGEAATFMLSQVIPGWTEGLQKMNVGSTYELVLPPSLAYGEQGAPPVIPPNSVLVFNVELLSIEDQDKSDDMWDLR